MSDPDRLSRRAFVAGTVAAAVSLAAGIAPRGLFPPDLAAAVAVEFDAPAASDRALLALGLSLEHALGPIAPPKGSS